MAEERNINDRRKPPPGIIRPAKVAVSAAGGGGEIVEVHGGHIVRSTGRKDRHSKVCTAKGPRDRRVRLSAHTAIQFYDVQDRLGYDRPSKAVDWLINKAKAAIDELAELPPWDPTEVMLAAATAKPKRNRSQHQLQSEKEQQQEQSSARNRNRNRLDFGGGDGEGNRSQFLMPSLDTDPSADTTINSFSPSGGARVSTAVKTPEDVLQSYNQHRQQQNLPDFLAGTGSHNQDLRLSLQSFHDPPPPMILHHNNQETPVLFGAPNNPLGFDLAAASSGGWENQQPTHQRLAGWSGGGDGEGGGGTSDSAPGGNSGGVFMFSSPANPYQPIFGHNQLLHSQRGTLQSNNSLSFRAWVDHHHHQQQPVTTVATADDLAHYHFHHNHHQHHIPSPAVFQSVIPGYYSGFRIPARFEGEVVHEEHDGGVPNNPPSNASSVSRH